MVIVMDMSTGKTSKLNDPEAAAEEFGAFVDEVLNAGWLPPAPRLEIHEHPVKKVVPAVDADEFLRTLYRNQE
jgi:hypothetical protein